MDALDAVLRPIASLLNRNIDESTPARELCRRLDGKTVAVRVRDSALALYFTIDSGIITLASEPIGEPDVIVSGSLLGLARMIGESGEAAIRDGTLQLSGDASAARAFQALLYHARPDIEDELSKVVGDAAAHRVGEAARGVRNWAREARATMSDNLREYLQEESRDVPSRYEFERFGKELDALRDGVERAAAKFERLAGER
jgi:ubiquinone biosynthesis accessory factor UbiJ